MSDFINYTRSLLKRVLAYAKDICQKVEQDSASRSRVAVFNKIDQWKGKRQRRGRRILDVLP